MIVRRLNSLYNRGKNDMSKYLFPVIAVILYSLSGCTLVDYESTKTESPPVKEVNDQNKSTLESRVNELEQRVKELEDKLKAQW
jgi:uncharacterized membrane protein YgcG